MKANDITLTELTAQKRVLVMIVNELAQRLRVAESLCHGADAELPDNDDMGWLLQSVPNDGDMLSFSEYVSGANGDCSDMGLFGVIESTIGALAAHHEDRANS